MFFSFFFFLLKRFPCDSKRCYSSKTKKCVRYVFRVVLCVFVCCIWLFYWILAQKSEMLHSIVFHSAKKSIKWGRQVATLMVRGTAYTCITVYSGNCCTRETSAGNWWTCEFNTHTHTHTHTHKHTHTHTHTHTPPVDGSNNGTVYISFLAFSYLPVDNYKSLLGSHYKYTLFSDCDHRDHTDFTL